MTEICEESLSIRHGEGIVSTSFAYIKAVDLDTQQIEEENQNEKFAIVAFWYYD